MNRRGVMILTLAVLASQAFAGNVEKAIETPVHQTIGIEQKTQADELRWRDEKEKKSSEFETLEKELAHLEAARNTEAALNETLRTKVSQKQKQLADIAEIEAQISPFLSGLLGKIEALDARDLPFLQEERGKRIEALKALNADPETQVSEKFRKLMEALLVEAEYGQTVEVYQQTVPLDGEETLVNIFRLGRLRLFYQTLDKRQCGYFNTAQKAWQPLPDTYLKTLQAAVDMGSKRKPVEILDLPLGRMVAQ